MPDSIDPKRRTRSRRARLLALVAFVSGVLVAGCGGSPSNRSAANGGGAAPLTASAMRASSTAPSAGSSGPLAFARCMRANGVPNFPDPSPGRGLEFKTDGVDPAAPAFKAAQAKCQKLLGGGFPGLGSTTHPSAQTLAKLVKIAQCMRHHGVPQFPDPGTSIPSNPAAAGIREVTDFDQAILLFPSTLNMQAPAYTKALTACHAPPLGLPH